MRLIHTLALCSFIPTLSIANAQTPVIQGTPTAGQTIIKGLGASPVAAAGDVKIFVCVAALSPSPLPAAPACIAVKAAPLAAGAAQPITTGPNGEFTAELASPLIAGYYVYISQAGPAPVGNTNSAVATIAAAPVTTTTLTLGSAAITTEQKDDIIASVTSTTAGVIGGNIQFYDGAIALGAPVSLNNGTAKYTVPFGGLTDSAAGTAHSITAKYTPVDSIYATSTSSATTITVTTAPNEREHTDFIAGATFSADGNNYSQGDLFLALNYDRTIYRPGWFHQKDGTCGNAACLPNHHPGFNTFFQARLTTIPVNTSANVQATTTPAGSSTPAPTTSTTSVNSFLSAQKTAQFQAGGYMPWLFGKVPSYKPKGEKTDTFFIGPVARFGFSTPSSAPGNTTSASSNSTTITTTPSTLGTNNNATGDQLYNFWFGGFRVGTANLDPGSIHIVHYFDIGVGKYSNLQSLTCKAGPGMCQSTAATATIPYPTNESRTTLLRLAFEGYMEIPTTSNGSLILGINANYGPGSLFPKPPGLDINNRAADDLTFLIGYKFDVSQLLSAIPILGNGPSK